MNHFSKLVYQISVSTFFFILSFSSLAQGRVLYTGIVNYLPDGKEFPLFGLVNIVGGDHSSVQMGLINHSQGSFYGFQLGLVNQGVVDLRGCQMGLMNTASDDADGAQIGLINSANEVEGSQIGLINRAKRIDGAQIGLLNVSKVVDGLQFGLVNKSDSVGNGVPIGLLYQGKGGLFTLDVGFTEMHPLQVSLRTGIDKIYFILSTAYSDNRGGYVLLGTGVGTKIGLSEKSSISPEFQYITGLSNRNNFDYYSVSLNYGLKTSNKLGFTFGPSFGFNAAPKGKSIVENPAFINLSKSDGSSRLGFVVGLRASVRFDLAR